jgi:dienelactone hydrolase
VTDEIPIPEVKETSLWFGGAERPLFGRLTAPSSGMVAGGVLISPPIGREARLARRALRGLAISLATGGYVCLRFDHYGTGDSVGTLEEEDFDVAWSRGIEQGVELLRSCGVSSVAAVGMRLGATILGVAASEHDLQLSSAVLWDPCDSGRTYAREMRALEALRRSQNREPLEVSEFVFSDKTAARLTELSLSSAASHTIAKRLLIVAREDRAVPQRLRERLDAEGAEWTTTSEQSGLLEVELPKAMQPDSTLAQIESWMTSQSPSWSPYLEPADSTEAVVARASNVSAVRERFVALGPHQMFGVLSEPVGEIRGPLIVMVNGINEDHVGPSRLWVELARRWGGYGLRTLRFDFNELGESLWVSGEDTRLVDDHARLDDVCVAVAALNLGAESDAVLVGLCTGAQLALEVALRLRARGVCVINPQVGARFMRNALLLEKSSRGFSRSIAKRFKAPLNRHLWLTESALQAARMIAPSAYSLRMRSALAAHGTEMLLLASSEDLLPFPWLPIVSGFDRRRMVSSPHCRVEIVPGLDHDMLNAVGRGRAVSILDGFVLETFAAVAAPPDGGRLAEE